MKIAVDAFGGDNAPLSVIDGCAQAMQLNSDIEIVLYGDEEKIKICAQENNIDISKMEIVHTYEIFDMHDEPKELLKSKKNTSLALAFKAVANSQADAIVSAGSTGAILMGATFIVKRIKGVKRAAIATVLPTTGKPYLLIDSGANINARPEALLQFGMLGAAYMQNVMGIKNPTVGLLNNGVEDTKGGDTLVEAYKLLDKSTLNFIGNVEARDVPSGACDVLVADGFAGNVVLKLTEGLASSFMSMFKDAFMANAVSKLSALALKPQLRKLKKKLDYSEYGGAPFLGARKPVIKAHGSSNAKAIKSAIMQANNFAKSNFTETVGEFLDQMNAQDNAGEENV